MNSKLDLRRAGELSVADAKIITALEPVVRNEYNRYIGELVQKNHVEGEQWLIRATCRNTHISLVHDRFCRLALLESKLRAGELLDDIILDSASMHVAVRQLLNNFASNADIHVTRNVRQRRVPLKLYFLLNLINNIYQCFNHWFWSKFISVKKLPLHPILLLDTFWFSNKDRYYPRLVDSLPSNMKGSIYYLPMFFGIRYPWEWFRQIRIIAASKDNFVLKEQWLKFSDYVKAITKSLFLPSSIGIIPKWRELDVSSIVQEELLLDRGSFLLTQALLITRSFERYKQSGVQIKGVVDWFENQVVDRALELGIKQYYPEVKTKGYMGFVAEGYYAGLSPMVYEQQGKVLPDELLVIGKAYVDKKRAENHSLAVSIAPALRFQNTMKYKQNDKVIKSTILLAMPMMLYEAERIIKLAQNTLLDSQYKWKIKVHPTISEEKFRKLIPASIDDRFTFTNNSLINLFQETKLLVTSASSVAIEAILCGVSVAIMGSRSGPTINPLKDVVDESYWSVCYEPKELENAILSDFPKKSLDTAKYLEPITTAGIMRMMQW